MNCIDNNKTRVVEARLRSKELSDYLKNLKTVRTVWLSEDATAIVSKVNYDVETNQLIGNELPFDKNNGCPIPFSFMATNADKIKQHLQKSKSKLVYIVMAQPLDESIPPFLLQMFGTNSSFKAQDVIRRWEFTKSELKKYVNLNQ